MSKRKRSSSDTKGNMPKKGKTDGITHHEKMLLKELGHRELKYIDLFRNGSPVQQIADNAAVGATANFDPTEGCLNFCAVGDTNLQRTGRKILMKSLRMRFIMHWVGEQNVVTFAEPDPVRLVIYLDKTANTTPNSGADTQVFGVGGVDAFQNVANLGKYEVLYDKVINPTLFQQDGLTSTNANYGGCYRLHKLQLKWKKGIVVNYNANPVADIRQLADNALHCMMWINSTNEVGLNVAYRSRVTFSDL